MNTIPDFIAIDFETATRKMDSACSIGIAIVKDGYIADKFYSLIQPPDNSYDPHNSEIHGITPADTAHSPRFYDVWIQIKHLFGYCPVIAHNANFDMSVLAMCCKDSWITPANFKYLDTINLCREIVPGSKSLSSCVDFFGIRLENHHNALDDAIACAEVALACIKHAGENSLTDFAFKTPHILIHNFSEYQPMEIFRSSHDPHTAARRKHFDSVSPKEICACTKCFDTCHPFYGKNMVFTGELSIDRRTAMQMAVDVGAIIKSSVSGKTNYLVVGTQDPTLVGSDGLSSKEEKAYALNESGKAHIQIIKEDEFCSLLNGTNAEKEVELNNL